MAITLGGYIWNTYKKYFCVYKVYEIGNKNFFLTHLSCFLVVSYDFTVLKAYL